MARFGQAILVMDYSLMIQIKMFLDRQK